MPLAERCLLEFDSAVRKRGQEYFLNGHVVPFESPPREFDAIVTVEREYHVVLDWRLGRDELGVCCTCRFYEDKGLCKHIWATILAADRLKNGPKGRNRLELVRLDPDDFEQSDDESSIDDDDFDELPRRPARVTANSKSKRGKVSPKAKWQQQLAWSINDAEVEEAPPVLPGPSQRTREIWYVLDALSGESVSKPLLLLFHREARSTGKLGKLKPLSLSPYDIDRLVTGNDAEILRLLLGYQSVDDDVYGFGYSPRVSEVVLPKGAQQFLLPKLAATGRLARIASPEVMHPEPDDLLPLAWDEGPPWRFRLDIARDDERQQWVLSGQLYREGGETLPLHAAVTIFKQGVIVFEGRVALLETAGTSGMIEALRRTPCVEVPYKDRWELLRRLWQLPTAPEMNLPDELRAEEIQMQPQGRLMVDKPERYDPYRLPGRVDFLYGDKSVSAQDTSRAIIDEANQRVVLRDRQRERELAASLAARHVRAMDGWQTEKYNVWISSSHAPAALEALIIEGWIVEAQGYHIRRAGAWRMNVTSGVDWFDLAGTINFDGLEAQLPEILEALRRGQNYVRLSDGSRGLLPQDWLARFASMAELGEAADGVVRFRSSQALLLDALLAAQEQVTVDAPFARLRENLRSFNGIGPASEPRGFCGQLRHYQKAGLGWLGFLQEFRLGGCLADDMGLGKTVQVLAMLQDRRCRQPDTNLRSPSLAVVPRSLVFNWIEEAKRFTPDLRVLDYTGIQRRPLMESFNQYDLIITTYGTMQRDIVQLKDIRFDYAILDESQAIKNAQSQRAKASRLLNANHRLAMTGTPVENHLGELWSLLEFLNPGMLGTAKVFQNISKSVSEDNEGLGLLRRALGPFILRRTKQQVLTELPPKTEQTLHCDLEGKQRKRYDELRTYYRAALAERIAKKGMKQSKIHVLEALLRLRQAAIHPGLIDRDSADDSSAKLDVLMEQLREVIDEGHKALVFSQFTSFLAIVRDRLDRENVVYEYLDGRTRQRQERVERFQNDPKCPLFLISLKAGGHGLNLTAADYVFILDPWWNPAVEAQAIDRAHRIGQDRHVFAYRLIARDTVEEKIIELQQTKRDLAEAIISADGNLISRLTAEDLELLLS
jgi:superfamily II DNA or RNA helicase